MKFISMCSGIEAASVAFNPLGWEAICFSEIEPFPSALLQERFPHVPNMGDMSRYDEWPEEFFAEADMIVGGPPCQSFSVAGKRGGLDDDRGNLTLIFTELIDHADAIRRKHNRPPVIVLYENVPGLLSDKTNAFGCLLGALAGEDDQLNPSGQRWTNAGVVLGPERTIAWRILDAQYFRLAQRRKRVFVIASAREGFSPSEILFEFDGVRRDTAPSREQGKETAGDVGTGAKTASAGHGFRMTAFGEYADDDTASTMKARDYKDATDLVAYGIPGNWIGRKPENGGNSTQFMHEIAPNQTATDKHGVVAFSCKDYGADAGPISPTLRAMGHVGSHANGGGQVAVAFNSRQDPISGEVFGALDTGSPQTQAVTVYPLNTMTMLGRPSDDLKPRMGSGIGKPTDPQNTLSAAHCHAVATATAVRRLTPVECERLQGFPDNWTQITWRNKPASECPDGHRYKALGNSWAVPVVYWIGKRIANFLDDTEITW